MHKILGLMAMLLWASVGFAQVNNARMLTTPNAQTGTTYTFVAADTTRVVTFSNASPVAATLPNGATVGFGAGTMISIVNLGAGAVTITCSSCTINGAATLVLSLNQGADIYGGAGVSAVNYVAVPSPSGNVALLNTPNTWSALNTFSAGISADGANTETIPSATGTLADIATSQTLKNKSLASSSSGNSVTLLNFQGPLAPVTGTGAAATYYAYTLPASTIASGKGIRITVITKHSTGTTSASMTLSFGGTSTATMGDDGTANSFTKIVYEIFNNASTSAQVMGSALTRGAAGAAFVRFDTAAVNTTSGVVINAQFNVANTDAVTPEMFLVELIQ